MSPFLTHGVYADDIILLSATVDGLQKMCDVCVKAASDLKFTFMCHINKLYIFHACIAAICLLKMPLSPNCLSISVVISHSV